MKLVYSLLAVLSVSILLSACYSKKDLMKQRYIAEGMVVYQNHCQNCHQADGSGFEKLIPPLTDTAYLLRERARLPCIIRFGMKGPVTIGGELYDQPMIANEHLTEMEIAEVLTYITNAFGNRQEIITIEEVRTALASCAP